MKLIRSPSRSASCVSTPVGSHLELLSPVAGYSVLVALLYRCFRLITGLRTRHLPDHREVFAGHRFTLVAHKTWLTGLFVSELWQHRR